MKATSTGAVSGCVVWIILLCVLGSCILPVSFSLAGYTKKAPIALKAEGAVICPKGTKAQYNSYEMTYRDSNGIEWPGTSTSLQCLDVSGNVVKDDPLYFVLAWDGIGLIIGILVTILIAFVIAAPAGVLIGRAMSRITQKTSA